MSKRTKGCGPAWGLRLNPEDVFQLDQFDLSITSRLPEKLSEKRVKKAYSHRCTICNNVYTRDKKNWVANNFLEIECCVNCESSDRMVTGSDVDLS